MSNIKPFFHLQNYKVGISDAILDKGVDATPRSPEYREGYDFGYSLRGALRQIEKDKHNANS